MTRQPQEPLINPKTAKKIKPTPRSRRRLKKPTRKQIFFLELSVFLIILVIFAAKAANYFGIEAARPERLFAGPAKRISAGIERIRQHKSIGRCPADTKKIIVDWSYVCRREVPSNKYVTIFDTYSKLGHGRELIYNDVARGNLDQAKEVVEQNKYNFQRFDSTVITNPVWNENPHNDRYWRFNYYGLQIINDLLYAYKDTGDKRYADKAIEIMNSFFDKGGMQAVHSWDDYHAVAFRSMTLTNAWWELREKNILDIDLSTKILSNLEVHANFLSERNHFEASHNHGLNEAAALYLVGNAFPTLSAAGEWKTLGRERMNNVLVDLIDKDGALIENSPFYHFYVLRKAWNISQYANRFDKPMDAVFQEKLDKMVAYGTYILQPNNHPPTIGASLDSQIFYNAEFKDLAQKYPEFKYVLTQGQYGKRPHQINAYFQDAGQAILRSDFGKNFKKQLQATFQISGYRSKHSHLDALSFTLNEGDRRLLVDPGLYSYEEDPVSNYFESTAAHNTVIVDGKDQHKGESKLLSHADGPDFATSTGAHELYEGVTHSRTVTMLNKRTIIVTDNLTSHASHTYTQLFHFAPGTTAWKEGDVIKASFPGRKAKVTIRQLQAIDTADLTLNKRQGQIGGICSDQYKKLLSCPQASFKKQGGNVTFVTAIELDNSKREYSFSQGALTVQLGNGKDFTLSPKTVAAVARTQSQPPALPANPAPVVKPRIAIVMSGGNIFTPQVAPLMEQLGHKASITLPAQALDYHDSDTLTASEIRKLQNQFGWDVVNTAFDDSGALVEKLAQQEFASYEESMLKGAASLNNLGFKVNPNWFIYPKDTIQANSRLPVSKYYRFGLAPSYSPTASGDPLAQQSLLIADTTTPSQIIAAIDQAIAKNQTLILQFQSLKHSTDTAVQGFNIDDLHKVLQYMNIKGIHAMSLEGLDTDIGVTSFQPKRQTRVPAYQPIDVTSNIRRRNLWEYLFER